MPKDWCPFCPGSGRVPDRYDVHLYPNDFAAFRLDNESFSEHGSELFRKTGARGSTDVVLYHPNHNLAPSQMSREHWRKVVDLWTTRYKELAAIPDIAYVYIFENTGAAIGVTMPHPHGQIYAFPFMPPLAQRELDAAWEYYAANGECLYEHILREELADGRRIVAENATFRGLRAVLRALAHRGADLCAAALRRAAGPDRCRGVRPGGHYQDHARQV